MTGIGDDAFGFVVVTISIDLKSKTPGPVFNYELPDGQVITAGNQRLKLVLYPEQAIPEPDTTAVIQVVFYDEVDNVVAAVSNELSSLEGEGDD